MALSSNGRRNLVCVAALAAICILSRLPQLSSPNLLLDGDECILGLMAKHIAEGRAFPIFLYGQNYGLAVVEAPAGAVSFRLAGTGAVPLKGAMLGLWTLGIVAYFLAVSRLAGNRRGFLIALILILTPAWAASSMKAWSGYLTSFAATAALFNLLVQYRDRPGSVVWLMAGILTGIVYLAQPLWLPGVLPLVILLLFAHRRLSFGFLYLAGAASVVLAVRLIAAGRAFEYWTPPEIGNQHVLASLPGVFEQIYVNLTGSYNLRYAIEPGPVTAGMASLWCGALVAATLLQAYRLVSGRYHLWSHVLFLSVASTLLANWLLLTGRDGRYLLPLSALLVLWAGVEVCDLVDRKVLPVRILAVAIGGVIALEAWSMVEFRHFSFMGKTPANSLSEARRLETVVGYMRMKGATHVFSLHPMLQWQLAFYGKEEVVARWTNYWDRYPPYVAEVDRALQAGEPVALVGYVDATGGLETLVANPRAIYTVDDKYFVYVGADRELLKKMRFRFLADRTR